MMPTRRKTLTQPWSTTTEPRTWTPPTWLTWPIKQVRPRKRGEWVVRRTSGRGKGWLFLLNHPAWQLCTSRRATTVNAGSFVRRPLKWGEKTGKTIARSPGTLDLLEYLEWFRGLNVQGLNFPACGEGLLATECVVCCPISVSNRLERRPQESRPKVPRGTVPEQWALLLVVHVFSLQGLACVCSPLSEFFFLLSLSELTHELAIPTSKKKNTRMPSISTTSLWQSTEHQMCSRNANRWVGKKGCFVIS